MPEPSVSPVAPSLVADEAPPAACLEPVRPVRARATRAATTQYTITDLGVRIRSLRGAVEVNNAGQVAGTRVPEGHEHGEAAFVWDRQSGARDIADGFHDSRVGALNEAGQVAGSDSAGGTFLWDPGGGLRGLDLPEGFRSGHAVALNDGGLVLGDGQEADEEGDYRAIAWSPTQGAIPFGDWGWSEEAVDLNNSGQAVVTAWVVPPGAVDTSQHVFLWTPGGPLRDLGQGGGSRINDSGQVVGRLDFYRAESGGSYDCVFVWDPTTDTRTYLGAGTTGGLINDHGQVIGGFWPKVDAPIQAFIWDADSGMADLGALPGAEWSDTSDLNELGQVVGSSGLAYSDEPVPQGVHAFVWDPDTGMTDLGVLHKGDSSYAWDINDRGEIVGWSGTMNPENEGNDVGHAVIWTPN